MKFKLQFQLHPNPNLNSDSNAYSDSNDKCSRCREVNKGGPEIDPRNDRPGKMTGNIKKHFPEDDRENDQPFPENDRK